MARQPSRPRDQRLDLFRGLTMLIIFLASVALIVSLWLFFERSLYGKALRATAVNRLGAFLAASGSFATGSGTTVSDVNRLVKQFSEMQKMMKRMGAMGGRPGKKGKKGKGGKKK